MSCIGGSDRLRAYRIERCGERVGAGITGAERVVGGERSRRIGAGEVHDAPVARCNIPISIKGSHREGAGSTADDRIGEASDLQDTRGGRIDRDVELSGDRTR